MARMIAESQLCRYQEIGIQVEKGIGMSVCVVVVVVVVMRVQMTSTLVTYGVVEHPVRLVHSD